MILVRTGLESWADHDLLWAQRENTLLTCPGALGVRRLHFAESGNAQLHAPRIDAGDLGLEDIAGTDEVRDEPILGKPVNPGRLVELPNGSRVEAMLPNSAPGRAKFFEPGDAVEISWRFDAGRFLTE